MNQIFGSANIFTRTAISLLAVPLCLSAETVDGTEPAPAAPGGDLLQAGRPHSRKVVSPEKNLPLVFDPGKLNRQTGKVELTTTEKCLWVAKLGSMGPVGILPGTSPIAIGGGKILGRK